MISARIIRQNIGILQLHQRIVPILRKRWTIRLPHCFRDGQAQRIPLRDGPRLEAVLKSGIQTNKQTNFILRGVVVEVVW